MIALRGEVDNVYHNQLRNRPLLHYHDDSALEMFYFVT